MQSIPVFLGTTKVKRIRNGVIKCNRYLYFLVQQKLKELEMM